MPFIERWCKALRCRDAAVRPDIGGDALPHRPSQVARLKRFQSDWNGLSLGKSRRTGFADQACLSSRKRLANLRRATRAAAAAPKSRIIGGAGTSVPPLLLEDEDELLDEVLDEVEDEVDVEDEVLLDPPKLDELTLPDDVDTPPVDVLTPPVDVETPPLVELDVEVEEIPPDEVELLEVELTPPVEVLDPPLDVELLVDPPLVDVDPPLVVEETTMLPLLPPLPPKNPPKKPPLPPT